jgi:hypothetical protein
MPARTDAVGNQPSDRSATPWPPAGRPPDRHRGRAIPASRRGVGLSTEEDGHGNVAG